MLHFYNVLLFSSEFYCFFYFFTLNIPVLYFLPNCSFTSSSYADNFSLYCIISHGGLFPCAFVIIMVFFIWTCLQWGWFFSENPIKAGLGETQQGFISVSFRQPGTNFYVNYLGREFLYYLYNIYKFKILFLRGHTSSTPPHSQRP